MFSYSVVLKLLYMAAGPRLRSVTGRAQRQRSARSYETASPRLIFTPLDLEITSMEDAPVLLARIARRQYSALQVTEAFCKRAAVAQQCTGCLTALMYEKAVARARELDAFLERHARTVGNLHGLPVSLKVYVFAPDVKVWPLTTRRTVLMSRASTPMRGWSRGCRI